MWDIASNPGKKAAAFVAGVVACMVLLIAYVLSVKPAFWLLVHGYISQELYGTIYRPLFWLAEHWQLVDTYLTDYLDGI
jgi:hypothetical protein